MGGSTTSLNKSKMADGGDIKFRNMLISPYLMKVSAQSLVPRCNTTMWKCLGTKGMV